jgi:AcrR family transcriptional regulator
MSESGTVAANERTRDDGPRTRGGWIPAGTAAERRANHHVNGTSRGRRSRQRLIDAARRVFERLGYLDATIDDIITEAGVARGSFYTYFPDKLSVFEIVAEEVNEAVRAAVARDSSMPSLDPVQRLDAANRRYIETYRRHAKIYGLFEQIATGCPTVHANRVRTRVEHIERITASIRRWQRRGLADPTLDPATTAALLVSMTSNFCYWWFVVGEEHDDEEAAQELTATWVRVTGLRKRPRPSWSEGWQGKRARR